MASKLSKRMLKAWIKEERASSREYERYGFHNISNDEARHARILTNVLKEKLRNERD